MINPDNYDRIPIIVAVIITIVLLTTIISHVYEKYSYRKCVEKHKMLKKEELKKICGEL